MRVAVLFASIALAGAAAAADSYPSKAIRMVCPFATGSTADTLARVAAQALTEAFGRQVVVDNRTGAGGTIGAEIVARAPPGWLHTARGRQQSRDQCHAVSASAVRHVP